MFKHKIILVFCLLITAQWSVAGGGPCVTVQSGNWSDDSTWDCSPLSAPDENSEITIKSGHSVILDVDTIGVGAVVVEAGGDFNVAASANGLSLNINNSVPAGIVDLTEAHIDLSGDFTINANDLEISLGDVNGQYSLNLNSNQAIYLQGNIGGNNQPISMLTVNSVDQITIDTPSIFTLNSQNYSGYLVLNQNTVLNAQKIAVQNDFSIGTFEVFIINSDSSENSVILGDITGSGKIIKFGAGTLALFSVNPFSGTVWVDRGGLSNQTLVTSVFPNASEITLKAGTDSALGSVEFNEFNLLSGQILNGDGHCSCVLIANGNSLVSPGDEIGALSFDGFVMGTGSLLSFDINGTTASISYDQIVAEYVLFLTDDSQNDLQINLGFVPNQGDSFTLIENTGDDSVVGTFANLPEGSYLTINDYIFSISYVGGTGNDIVLTAIGESIVVFVDDDAAAMGDGKNWATAFNTLQDALEAVAANPEFNIDIWVADGVYYPDEGGAQVDNDRNASFTLVDGVSIYGGFFGDETTLNQRDVTTHVTILSGDISQNDINFDGNFIAENVTDIVSNNSYSILNGEYVDTNTFLDGVTVTAGNANGGSYPDNLGAGINCTVQPGPSIHNVIFSANNSIRGAAAMYGCAKNVSNALFISNVSNFSGGAIIAFGGNIEFSEFISNQSQFDGGAISNQTQTLTMKNTKFIGNQSNNGSGAAVSSRKDIVIEDSKFSGNKASTDGGALLLVGGANAQLLNVTITGNLASTAGAINSQSTGMLSVVNSIIWNNQDDNGLGSMTASIYHPNGNYLITNSLIQGSGGSGLNWTFDLTADGGNNLDHDPLFIYDTDPSFAPTDLGDAGLQGSSPAIDAGDNSFVTPDAVDLDYFERILNGSVDMGAFEYHLFNVTVNVSGLNGGTLVLENNSMDMLTVQNNGQQKFMTPVIHGEDYAVTIFSLPTAPNQNCVITSNNGTGSIDGMDVTIDIECTTVQYMVGVDVSGLADGATLTLLNIAETLSVTQNGITHFATVIDDNYTYSVSIEANPSSPMQNCEITSDNANGFIDGADVLLEISCLTLEYSVGGTVTGLHPGNTLIAQINNTEIIHIENDGDFEFTTTIEDHQLYDVGILNQPDSPIQKCQINNEFGTVNSQNVTNILIECDYGDDMIYTHGFEQ